MVSAIIRRQIQGIQILLQQGQWQYDAKPRQLSLQVSVIDCFLLVVTAQRQSKALCLVSSTLAVEERIFCFFVLMAVAALSALAIALCSLHFPKKVLI